MHIYCANINQSLIRSKGQAEFKTENITTLTILKDIITKNATKKRITLEISTSTAEILRKYHLPHHFSAFNCTLVLDSFVPPFYFDARCRRNRNFV